MVYSFECEKCGIWIDHVGIPTLKEEHIKTGHGDNLKCVDCGHTAWRCYNFNVKSESYAKPIISDSLAMNPDQIPEHRERFPDVEVTAAGQPVFKSFKQHEAYLKKTGFYKAEKKVDGRHKKRIG